MPTKTQRILSYLPATFRPSVRNSVLRVLVNTFGLELQHGENSLAAVMAAHWVDHADRGADEIDDLARLAAMYSLTPRADEGVEEFREHLKRYVRTFLEGTVTVQGLLRVSAEALNLHIADAYDADDSTGLDTWWAPQSYVRTTFESRIDDAAFVLFGFHAATARGDDSSAARINGTAEIPQRIDVRQHRFVHLTVNAVSKEIDLQQEVPDASRVTRAQVIQKINDAFAPDVVAALADRERNGNLLRVVELTSPTTGQDGVVAVGPLPLADPTRVEGRCVSRAMVTDEAANSVLGFVNREACGTPATSFRLMTDSKTDPSFDLTRGIDLRDQNLLNISVDGASAFQVDCTGARARATLVDEVVDKINVAAQAAGLPEIASPEGRGIELRSPTSGTSGAIELQPTDPPERDAREKIFTAAPKQIPGKAGEPATIVGDKSVAQTVNLSERPKLRLSVNRSAPVDIDVAGSVAAQTSLDEVIDAINAVYPNMASRTDDDELKLSVPGDTDTHLAVLPLRHIDLIEYPKAPQTQQIEIPNREDGKPRHGDSWSIVNTGVCDVAASISIEFPSGSFFPAIVNHTLAYRARVMAVIDPGARVSLQADATGKLSATHYKRNVEGVLVPEDVQVSVERLQDAAAKSEVPTAVRDAIILTLPRGTSRWSYADCYASRFDLASFASVDAIGGARFAGGLCLDRGIIDASLFENASGTAPPENIVTVFASKTSAEPGVDMRFQWDNCDPGAIVVNLPADLPERFGGRFNQARFGKGGVVTAAPASSSDADVGGENQVDSNRQELLEGIVTEDVSVDELTRSMLEAAIQQDVSDIRIAVAEGIGIVQFLVESQSLEFIRLTLKALKQMSTRIKTLANLDLEIGEDAQNGLASVFISGRMFDLRITTEPTEPADQIAIRILTPNFLAKAVTEPSWDQNALQHLIPSVGSKDIGTSLVTSSEVPIVPLGFEAAGIPFRKAKFLTGGTDSTPARIYLSEVGRAGFILLEAREPGIWGNQIYLTAYQVGPAIYEIEISFDGARIEFARDVVMGEPVPAVIRSNLQPGNVGVLQAKAAGIRADVTRNLTQ